MENWYERKPNKNQHLVYLSKEAQELTKLLNKEKTMIMRGGTGKKCPLGGRAKEGDSVYLVETGGDMEISYKGVISKVVETGKMVSEESEQFIKKYEKQLNLSDKQYQRWNCKRYLAVYEITDIKKIKTKKYIRKNNMDDWIIIDNISNIIEGD